MKKRIVFAGTPSYATTILDKILSHSSFEVVALWTQEDKKVGRKQLLTPPHIKEYCINKELDFPIYQPSSLRKDESAVEILKSLKPDFIVVAAYGQILPKEILELCPCINLHASLLPLYRGASPIQECLLNDDNYTGVTSMLMEEGLDTGDILGFKYLKIEKMDNATTLFEKLSNIAASLCIDTLENFESIKPKRQNNSLVTLCKKIKKDDGEVDFTNAKEIYLKSKAYSFWPTVFTKDGLKLSSISLNDTTSQNSSGEILEICKDYIVIGCKKGSLKIGTLQMPSKKALSVEEFLKGQQNLQVGSNIVEVLFRF